MWKCPKCGHTEYWNGVRLLENGNRIYMRLCGGAGCICTFTEIERIEPSLKHLLPKEIRPFDGQNTMIPTPKTIITMQPKPRFTSINGHLVKIG